MQVDDVSRAAAVDVGQAEALPIELVREVKPRRIVHCDLSAEAAITQVRPVADLAVADTHQKRTSPSYPGSPTGRSGI